MSFYDDPIVDDNSKRSEESVNAVKSLFTRKNGFISREESPDYGVDLDVELIFEEKGASSKKFAIQIKSTSKVSIVTHENNPFLSLEFKTSRIGYLARREPAYGLIILYDEVESICYFDYVEDIVARLDEFESKAGWREQKTVSLLLPNQKITSEELKQIHKKFLIRHQNSHLLLHEHGQRFNIPILDRDDELPDHPLNFNDPNQVAEFLEKYGNFLFSEHEFRMILQMLTKLTNDRIQSSVKLIFLSLITYTQSGNVIEAEYYLRKSSRVIEQMSEEEKGIIEFSKIRIEFLKGNIDYPSFLLKFKDLSKQTHDIENQLTIDINVLYFELASSVINEEMDFGLLQKIDGVFKKISEAEIHEEKRHLLKVYHSETQHMFGIQAFINFYNKYKIKTSLNIEIPVLQRAEQANLTISLTNAATVSVSDAYEFAKEKDLPLLKATAAHQLGKNFLSLRLALLLIPKEDKLPQIDKEVDVLYGRYHNLSLIAYNQFLEMYMFENAHEALTNAYEVQRLCLNLTNSMIGTLRQDEILMIIREIEAANDLIPFQSQVDSLSKIHSKDRPEGKSALFGASENEIVELAKGVLKGYELPEDRLPNIIHDLKMYKAFEERCQNPNIEFLQHLGHTTAFKTHYASPPTYILRHKTLKIETKPSSDIDYLLNEFSTILDQ